jgi:hypothetical protein
VDAVITAKLNQYEVYLGYIVPQTITGTTNSSGQVTLVLWPNQLGSTESMYTIKIVPPGGKSLTVNAVVPNVSSTELHLIAELPAYDGKTDGQLILDAAVAAGSIAVAKAAEAQASANAAASSQSIVAASASASASSAASSATSASTATTRASQASTSATASAASAATASTKASEAAASAVSAAADRVQTGLDKVQTASDKAGTRSDSIQTGLDRAATAADVVQTGSDRTATVANRAQTGLDRVQTGLDRTQVGVDKSGTTADLVQTGLDRAASSSSASAAASSATTAASLASTAAAQAGIATAQAVISTTQASSASTSASGASSSAASASTSASTATTQAGIATTQASAASASATSSASSATAANTSAGASSGSAAQALAIYGSTQAQADAVTAAQAAQSAAQGFAASAASVLTQDLSGIAAQALHRSPNAVTSMFVYDTSKDSDGGAWTEKCQQTSWYNEKLSGTWLGANASEIQARFAIASVTSLGRSVSNIGNNGGQTSLSISNNVLTVSWVSGSPAWAVDTLSGLTIGSVYKITGTFTGTVSYLRVGTSAANGTDYATTGLPIVFTATATTMYFSIGTTSGNTLSLSGYQVSTVVNTNTNSGDYLQFTPDGKFYRLWKNLLKYSNALTNGVWNSSYSTVTATTATTAPDGSSTAFLYTEIGSNGHNRVQSVALTAGITYTVSAYMKNSTRRYGSLSSSNYNNFTSTFDLQTPSTVASTGATSTITSIGNGWYLCTMTFVANTTVTSTIGIGSNNSNNGLNQSYALDGNTDLYFWHIQIETGSAVTAYEDKSADGATTEVFRGNKAKFPKLCAIVAEGANVTIYDLTEAGRPMWMRAAVASNNNWWNGSGSISALSAINAQVFISSNGNGGHIFEFTSDSMKFAYASNAGRPNGGISTRHNALNWIYPTNYIGIASNTIYAVAMTVLPDAPLDPVTGLPVPTIAVATVSGVSVIKHDGSLVTKAYVSATCYFVSFDGYNLLVSGVGPDTFNGAWIWNLLDDSVQNYGALALVKLNNNIGGAKTISEGKSSAAIQGSGVNLLRPNKSNTNKAILARIYPTYNTGHLLGDIRRAYLADSVVESITGPELVVNGTFNTDASGWTSSTANVSAVRNSSGQLEVTNNGAGYVYQAITVTPNVPQVFYGNFVVKNGGGRVLLGNSISNAAYVTFSGAGTGAVVFTPTQSTIYLSLGDSGNGTGVVNTYDDLSIKIKVLDRSYKAASANIYGTLTKALTNTANQVVAYSGFSTANYLQEPYSADLDFGTGEFSVSTWLNMPTSALSANYPVYGSDLLAGAGAFTSSTGWTGLDAECTVSGGSLTKIGTVTHYVTYPLPALTLGDVVLVKFDVTVINGNIPVRIGHAPQWNSSVNNITSTGTHYRIFTAFNINFGNVVGFDFGGGVTGTIQNLTVFKVKPSTIVSRKYSSGAYFEVVTLGPDYIQANAFDGTTTRTVTYPAFTGTNTNPVITKDTWQKIRAVYRPDGSLAISVNGIVVATTYGNPLLTLNNANAVLTIGNSYALDAPFPGSLAMLKLSATAPTQEQSTFMYEQEKQMFRDGANCLLPDANTIVDLAYDEVTDKWISVSATNEASWTGLVRTAVTAVPAGSYSKVQAGGGVKLNARSTTSPGVDVTIPAYGLREELVKRGEAAARLSRLQQVFDYIGGFTCTTVTGNTAVTAVAGSGYPAQTTIKNAVITGVGIPASTYIVDLVGTTAYLSAKATGSGSAALISFTDFVLPVGYETVQVSAAGVVKTEGSTKDYTRLFDGFRETIRFGTAPGYNVAVQIRAVRSAT